MNPVISLQYLIIPNNCDKVQYSMNKQRKEKLVEIHKFITIAVSCFELTRKISK